MKKFTTLLIVLSAIIFWSCSGDSSTDPGNNNQLPTCSITEPLANAVYAPGSQITVKVNASATEGAISKVDFYVDGVVVNNDLTQPYEYTWNTSGVANGTHTLKAVAVDNSGDSKASEINIILGHAPVTAITAPANGSYYQPGMTVNITANATDAAKKSGKSISSVQFYIDGVLKSTSQNAPYAYSWNSTGAALGTHKIKVIAKDNTGLISGDSVSVNMSNNQPPVVTITQPNDSTVILPGSTVNIQSSCGDADGTISKVEFFIAGTLVSTLTAAPYNYSWNTAGLPVGWYSIKVKATDNSMISNTDSIALKIAAPNSEMVLVEGGTFQMGQSDPNIGGSGNSSNEQPVHNVTLSNFYISKFEVTQGEWTALMGTRSSFSSDDFRPVSWISWYNVLVYCNKRSLAEGLTPAYSINGSTYPPDWGDVPNDYNQTWNAVICNWTANGYRLPTEAEWEYAAKGGKNSHGYTYSGSNDLNAVAWNYINSGNTDHSVGTKLPNELGLHDMSGNIWEWCWDRYANYNTNSQTNPHGPTTGSFRILRGGCYGDSEYSCRVKYRFKSNPNNNMSISFGFRLARSL